MYDTKNPIAIQSKRWFVASLLDIMKSKPFNAITIQELSFHAKLDRRTFYRNFSSKEDVLSYHIKSLSEDLTTKLMKEDTLTIPIFLQAFFEIAKENKEFLICLKKNDLLLFLLNNFNELLPIVHSIVEQKFSGTFMQENIEYIFAFNTGGFWNILIQWIDGNFKQSPEDIAQIVHNLMIKTFPISY